MGIRQSIVGMLITAVTLGGTLLAAHNTGPVHLSVMANCEDEFVQPCITFDEGEWRRVDSYLPYAYHRVRACRPHRVYPCIAGHADSRGRVDGSEFDYYWRGRF